MATLDEAVEQWRSPEHAEHGTPAASQTSEHCTKMRHHEATRVPPSVLLGWIQCFVDAAHGRSTVSTLES